MPPAGAVRQRVRGGDGRQRRVLRARGSLRGAINHRVGCLVGPPRWSCGVRALAEAAGVVWTSETSGKRSETKRTERQNAFVLLSEDSRALYFVPTPRARSIAWMRPAALERASSHVLRGSSLSGLRTSSDRSSPMTSVQGTPITMGADHKLIVPDNPIVPFIEGDGTGRDIWRASRARARRGGCEGLRRRTQDRLVRGVRRREGAQALQQLAPGRDRRGLSPVPRRHQGPADDACRRRHPVAQRRPPSDARSLRLPAPRALVPGRAKPRSSARKTSTW